MRKWGETEEERPGKWTKSANVDTRFAPHARSIEHTMLATLCIRTSLCFHADYGRSGCRNWNGFQLNLSALPKNHSEGLQGSEHAEAMHGLDTNITLSEHRALHARRILLAFGGDRSLLARLSELVLHNEGLWESSLFDFRSVSGLGARCERILDRALASRAFSAGSCDGRSTFHWLLLARRDHRLCPSTWRLLESE